MKTGNLGSDCTQNKVFEHLRVLAVVSTAFILILCSSSLQQVRAEPVTAVIIAGAALGVVIAVVNTAVERGYTSRYYREGSTGQMETGWKGWWHDTNRDFQRLFENPKANKKKKQGC